ncbi:MAG: SDR family NAD(P)-dependent oxidoreductase [Spirochaetales bacterium]|nr:SDR family NAD(P)-dependent oxidoreductase [Spirochaetales bacterium]
MGEWVLITGAGKRVGREIALFLGKKGYNILVHYRSSERQALSLLSELKALGVEAAAVEYDFSDIKGIDGFFSNKKVESLPIAHLINSASIYSPDEFSSLSCDKLYESLNINAFAPMYLARAFSRLDSAKSVVNMIDARHKQKVKGYFSYDLSKKMLFELTNLLAIELAPVVRVNAVAPGLILANPQNKNEDPEVIKSLSLLKDIHALEDTLSSVLLLLQSPRITGQTIYTDAGLHLGG